MMRLLGLDVGDRRIGVAVSDPLGRIAQPLTVIPRKDARADISEIRKLVVGFGSVRLIVGLPLNLDGTLGAQGRKTKAFAEELERALEAPVQLVDERLTTKVAERALREAKAGSRVRRRASDKVAAAVILQGYIDGRLKTED